MAADRLRPSGIRAVFDRALQLESEGRDIVHLEIGRPHARSPEAAVRAAGEALTAGAVHYTPSRGTIELREAIAERAERDLEDIVVTVGGSEAVAATVMSVLEPGEEVVILDPAWPHYDGHVRLAGGVPVHVACDEVDEFQPDPERVASVIGRRTRMLVVSSPTNPTGAVIDTGRVAALAALCVRHDLIAISDEIYASFVYGDADHRSIAAEPGMGSRTVIVDSCSKTWSMTGWRVGWAIAPPRLAAGINAVHQHLGVCAPSFAQAGAVAALRHGDAHSRVMIEEYGTRRRELADALAGLKGVRFQLPQGAFYGFPRLPGALPATRLLEEAGVAVVPGEVFGAGYESHVRISYAVAADELAEGMRRLRDFLNSPGYR